MNTRIKNHTTHASIYGVSILSLKTHRDTRGNLTEIYRESWCDTQYIQWNYVNNAANVLRGVHVHPLHKDFLTVLSGELLIGLLDLRENSATFNQSQLVTLNGTEKQAIIIPNGVAHGFYSPKASTHFYGVDKYWNIADELGCHWASTRKFISWPCAKPILSERDDAAEDLLSLRQKLRDLKCW